MKKQLTSEEIEFILKEKDNLYTNQIALRLNRSNTAIRNFLIKNKIEHKTRVLNPNLLTPTEEKIYELLAKGCSNVEIGEKLFLARSTIATHVSCIYQKLALATSDKKENSATRVKATLKYYGLLTE